MVVSAFRPTPIARVERGVRTKRCFMIEPWKFRKDTLDESIFNQVVNVNEYHLPLAFEPDDIVIDIGAHIGSFAQAVVSRGCRRVYCIEPDRSTTS